MVVTKLTAKIWQGAVDICCDAYNQNALTPDEVTKLTGAFETISEVYAAIIDRENNATLFAAGKVPANES